MCRYPRKVSVLWRVYFVVLCLVARERGGGFNHIEYVESHSVRENNQMDCCTPYQTGRSRNVDRETQGVVDQCKHSCPLK